MTASLTNNSGVPSSQSLYDTTRVQNAINACTGPNKAVELALGSEGANAFLLTPITLKSGVILLIDSGVTVFASLDPSVYNDASPGTCGTITTTDKGCNPLITIPYDATNTGIMGAGTIDGQGGQTLLNVTPPEGWAANCPNQTNYSWWCLTDSAKAGTYENDPILVRMSNYSGFINAYNYASGNGNNLIIYETTFQNAPNGHLSLGNCLSCTIYGVTINTPMKAHETDGIDLGNAEDVTVYGSTISDGDDNIAMGGTSYPGEYISIYKDHIFSGHGISIGSETQGGVHDIDVNTVSFSGSYDGTGDYTDEDTAINIKSAADRGGIVQNVTYSNICMQDVARPIQITPFYEGITSGSLPPQFGPNILIQNVNEISTTPSATLVVIQGYSATYPLSLQLDNVILYDITEASLSTKSYLPEYASIAIGPGPVTDLLADTLTDGKNTDITITSDTNNGEAHYACPGTFGFGTLPALP